MNLSKGNQTRILVVEDSPFNRQLIGQMVRKMGFDVEFAENGRIGVEKVQSWQPDLVLMDIHMPELDGIQAAAQIKALENIEYTPVMFVSSGIELDELRHAIESGGDDYIQRPFPYELLEAKVIAHLRTSELYRQVAVFSEQRAREEEIAESLFSNAIEVGNVTENNVQIYKRAADTFSGDVQLSARRPNGDINVLLGDFTGHGLMASIGALPLSETFRTMTSKGFEGQEILRQINNKMLKLLPTHMFLAVSMVTISTEGYATIWNLGLPDVYLFENGVCTKRFASMHPPLGIIQDLGDIRSTHLKMEKNQQLLLASDGVIEAVNAEGELYGEERLLATIASDCAHNEAIIDSVLASLNAYMGEQPQLDDISMIAVSAIEEDRTVLFKPKEPVPTAATTIDASEESQDVWEWSLVLNGKSLARIDPVAQAVSRLTEAEGQRDEWQGVFTILTELFVNALDHGILGLSSELKSSPEGFAQYFMERDERMAALHSGSIHLKMVHSRTESSGHLYLSVHDSGSGFDIDSVLKPSDDESSEGQLCGRGIKLIGSMCDQLKYSDEGRLAEVSFSYSI